LDLLTIPGPPDAVRKNYDYVIAEMFPPPRIVRNASIPDPQRFMAQQVVDIEQLAATKGVNIYGDATDLPDPLKADYDTLWTPERMDRVISALKNGGVAMEINDVRKVPSAAFIKRAKAAGVKFTFGGGNTGPGDLGRLSYCIDMVSECALKMADIWIP